MTGILLKIHINSEILIKQQENIQNFSRNIRNIQSSTNHFQKIFKKIIILVSRLTEGELVIRRSLNMFNEMILKTC